MPEGILEQKKGGAKNVQMKRNRKRRTLSTTKKKRKTQRNIRLGFLILGIVLVVMLIIKINNPGFFSNKYYEVDTKAVDASKPDIDVELLTPNPYSRSQEKTDKITGIVIHYTANPGATAIGNRNYFEGLKDIKSNALIVAPLKRYMLCFKSPTTNNFVYLITACNFKNESICTSSVS